MSSKSVMGIEDLVLPASRRSASGLADVFLDIVECLGPVSALMLVIRRNHWPIGAFR